MLIACRIIALEWASETSVIWLSDFIVFLWSKFVMSYLIFLFSRAIYFQNLYLLMYLSWLCIYVLRNPIPSQSFRVLFILAVAFQMRLFPQGLSQFLLWSGSFVHVSIIYVIYSIIVNYLCIKSHFSFFYKIVNSRAGIFSSFYLVTPFPPECFIDTKHSYKY